MPSLSARSARLIAVVLALSVTALPAQSVGAHTDFDYSVPTNEASVGEPVSEVTVAFTLPVTLVGNGFEVLDPQENLLQPFAVTDDDTVFRLQFDPPLAGGAVGVKYTVTAQDGHVLSGAFSFTVSVDLPPETTAPPATEPPSTEPPATEPPAAEPPSTEPPTAAPVVTTPGTVPVEPAAAESATEAPTATSPGVVEAPGDGEDSSNSGLLIGIAIAVAGLAAAFLVFRSRTSPAP